MQDPSFSFAFNESAASRDQILNRIYTDRGDARRALCEEINFPSAGMTYLAPGVPLVIPHSQNFSVNGKNAAQTIAQNARGQSSGIIMSPSAAEFQNEEMGLLSQIILGDDTSGLGVAVSAAGRLGGYLEARVGNIKNDLEALDSAYKTALKNNIKLNSSQFRDMKGPIEARLDKQITGFARDHIFEKGHARTTKKALGISHRGATKAFKAKGDAMEIKAITKGIGKTQSLAQKMKTTSNALTVLSVGLYGHEVLQTYKEDGLNAGGRKAAENTGKFFGGKMGAKMGGAAGVAMAAKVATGLALGVGTGGVGFAVLGLAGVIVGAGIGSKIGGTGAGAFYDGVGGAVTTTTDAVTGWFGR